MLGRLVRFPVKHPYVVVCEGKQAPLSFACTCHLEATYLLEELTARGSRAAIVTAEDWARERDAKRA